jgi:hypothetical protein
MCAIPDRTGARVPIAALTSGKLVFAVPDRTWLLLERGALIWAPDYLSSLPMDISHAEGDHFPRTSRSGTAPGVRLEEAHKRDSFSRT